MEPGVGLLVLAGQAPTLGQALTVPTGTLVMVGLEPDLDPGIERPPVGALGFIGAAPALLVGALAVPTGPLVLAGLAPTSTDNTSIIPPIDELLLQGLAPGIPVSRLLGAGAVVLSGAAPSFAITYPPAAGALAFSGHVPSPAIGTGSPVISPPAGSLVLSGPAPFPKPGVFASPGQACLHLTQPGLVWGVGGWCDTWGDIFPGPIIAGITFILPVPAGTLVLAGHSPSAGIPPAQLVLQGLAPSLVAPIIAVPAGSLTLQGFIDPLFDSGSQTTSVTSFAVRRVREFPFVTEEQMWLFFHRLQIYMEMGVGLDGGATVQGHDPQILLQWSDTNGRTWSNERRVSAGKAGEFRRRALWRRLGRSRKRMFRVIITDPVRVRLIDAYLELGKGTS